MFRIAVQRLYGQGLERGEGDDKREGGYMEGEMGERQKDREPMSSNLERVSKGTRNSMLSYWRDGKERGGVK
jgi:hypothetical protein